MNTRYITRGKTYFRKYGLLKTLARLMLQVYRVFKKNCLLLYRAESHWITKYDFILPDNIIVDRKETFDDVTKPDMQKIVKYWQTENEIGLTKERFSMGAVLWVLRCNSDIAGFGWSSRGDKYASYYMPLTDCDAVLFDYFIFKEYRGQSLYALFLNHLTGVLFSQGILRIFIETREWNSAGIKGLEKTFFRLYGKVKKFNFSRHTLTIWTKLFVCAFYFVLLF